MQNIVERVKRGAKLLDERIPNWADRIDLYTFDIENTCNCVVGQLFYGYCKGLDELGVDYFEDCDYGFDTYLSGEAKEREHHELELIWLQEINKRRNNE